MHLYRKKIFLDKSSHTASPLQVKHSGNNNFSFKLQRDSALPSQIAIAVYIFYLYDF